ncbi:hypothetical protein H8356DRAFT_1386263, partial [Neocallimastix lanati (nom. inval.)]
KEILKYESLHNYLEKEFDAFISILKHKIKDEIRNNSIPLGTNPKYIFNEVSQEMRFIYPEYKIIKFQKTRNINKQLSPDVITFNEIPDKSKYYKTERNENFMIFKNLNLLILQFSFQTKLVMNYNEVYLQTVLFILQLNLVIKCLFLELILI